MLPEWAEAIGAWCVVIGGVALAVCLTVVLVAAATIGAVVLVQYLRAKDFQSDLEGASRYLLWKVVRDARRHEDLRWVPAPVAEWAMQRVTEWYGPNGFYGPKRRG